MGGARLCPKDQSQHVGLPKRRTDSPRRAPATTRGGWCFVHSRAPVRGEGRLKMDAGQSHTLRAFVAVPLPAELRAKLGALQADLQAGLPAGAVRWTRADQIHLTLKFLGNVAAESLRDLESALQSACQAT